MMAGAGRMRMLREQMPWRLQRSKRDCDCLKDLAIVSMDVRVGCAFLSSSCLYILRPLVFDFFACLFTLSCRSLSNTTLDKANQLKYRY